MYIGRRCQFWPSGSLPYLFLVQGRMMRTNFREELSLNTIKNLRLFALLTAVVAFLAACGAGTQVTRVQAVPESADVPYRKILVISLLDSFDARIYLENELVARLAEQGVQAVASSSMMDSRVANTRKLYLGMVEDIEADAVLVSQLARVDTDATVRDMRPQATYNFRPTYYYNIWSVELTEYTEPQSVALGFSVVLASQVFSVSQKEAVWGIEAKFRVAQDVDQYWDYSVFPDQAATIATYLTRDGLIAR